MAQHYQEETGETEVVVSQGFTPLKPSALTTEGDVLPLYQPPADRSRIATEVYGGFAKCAYTLQKFQSDTERLLALVLERDALRWFRPVSGQFNIWYRRGVEQPEYVPDFVAATAHMNLLIETKRAADMDSAEVRAKAEAAMQWCTQACAYSAQHGGKPWRYLLIPHDAVQVNVTLDALVSRYGLQAS
jgi:type III restriction enzyme